MKKEDLIWIFGEGDKKIGFNNEDIFFIDGDKIISVNNIFNGKYRQEICPCCGSTIYKLEESETNYE